MRARLPFSQYFFLAVTAKPKTIVFLGFVFIAISAFLMLKLQKDTRLDAFIPVSDPSLQLRDRTRELFGLEDPMVIALIDDGKFGVFNPYALFLLDWLTREIGKLPNIDSDRVTSLATEKDITGTEEGMEVALFFDEPPTNQTDADKIRAQVMDFPLYLGSLVAKNGKGTLILAELQDQKKAQQTYHDLLGLAARAPLKPGEKLYVAGEGAVAGYMGAYIDADAVRLDPIAAIVITLICLLAFRTLRGMLLPNLVVLATAGSAIGLMAAFGVPFFVITNALPVVLIGIAVADSIHILSEYYQRLADHPDADPRSLTVATMVAMWRPITLTSLTTMAGFFGLTLASVMPPMKFFSLFALVGVFVAWVYSLIVVPAWLALLRPRLSRAYRLGQGVDSFGKGLSGLAPLVIRFPKTLILISLGIIIIGGIGASKIKLDENLIRTFDPEEPLFIADSVLNRWFDGTHYLDILIETPAPEGLFKPENLERIEALQAFVQTLPHVQGSTSLVDYLKQMNRALNEGQPQAYHLPGEADLAAQYFLLYSASASPDDFNDITDYDYRLANVRVRLNDGRYSVAKAVVQAIQAYIDHNINQPGIHAALSGRVNVDVHWIRRLGETHFMSMAISLGLVWLMASLSFRSLVAGFMAMLPVVVTILMIYAVMGFNGIWLSISTTMFAAIAIGLGVDFSIHTLERLQTLIRKGNTLDQAIANLYPSTGRALLFNFAALALGFGVLSTSKVVVLQEFGLLVAVAIATSFLTSMTLLPALVKVLRPRFMIGKDRALPFIKPQGDIP
ncbi:MAG: hypothetical protein AXA67_11265 [Methylothermaceae bacteria B42]|nr:MAG: hypothetical protein AXA67_11265 [Methylothermaceae bacteria B42]HHJ39111.1 Patched family protein [Methylothermaceae bacterium]